MRHGIRYMTDGLRIYEINPTNKFTSAFTFSTPKVTLKRPSDTPFFRAMAVFFILAGTLMCAPSSTIHGWTKLYLRSRQKLDTNAFATAMPSTYSQPRRINFDSEGFDVLLDNCANHTVTFDKHDFTAL